MTRTLRREGQGVTRTKGGQGQGVTGTKRDESPMLCMAFVWLNDTFGEGSKFLISLGESQAPKTDTY